MNNEEYVSIKPCLITPGWPIDDYPNGIVSYTQNLSEGMSGIADHQIISRSKIYKNQQTNIHSLNITKDGLQKRLFEKLLRLVDTSSLKRIEYVLKHSKSAQNIVDCLESESITANIIEIEESFGTPYWLKQKVNIPVITRLHGPWFIHAPIFGKDELTSSKIRKEFEKRGIETADGITSPSLDVLNRVRGFYDLELSNAVVIPNPVQPVSDELKWHYSANSQSILFVGRFDAHKGGDTIINAFNILAKTNPDVELNFVGPDRGITIDGLQHKILPYIHSHITDEHIRKRINYLGSLGAQEIAFLRKKSSVTVIASRYENFPMTAAEAMACGSPLIASNIGGLAEMIRDGVNGFHFEPGNPEALAVKIQDVMDIGLGLSQVSKNAILYAEERLSPKEVAKETLNYYKNFIT